MSNSLWRHGLQHARLPGPSPSLRACSNSCQLSQWFHPTISSSVIPFSCLQSFPVSGSFPMSQLFESGGQSIGASASVLPVNIQGWFPLGLTGWISLQSKGLSGVFSSLTVCLTVCLFRTYNLICCVNRWVGPWHHMIWVHYPTSVLFSSVWNLVSLYSAPECSLTSMLGKWVLGTSPDEKKKCHLFMCNSTFYKGCFQQELLPRG